MRDGQLHPLPIEFGRESVIKSKRVPRKAAAATKTNSDALKRTTAIGPGMQMQECSKRAVDQSGWLLEVELAHVALTKVKFDPNLVGSLTGKREHRRRGVKADDRPGRRLCYGYRDPPGTDRKLDQRAVRLGSELDVERHVLGHIWRPTVVILGKSSARSQAR